METNKQTFARLNKILKGSDGIVYLMFVGREVYAAEIQKCLVGPIYKHDANVNQAVKRLLGYSSEFLVFRMRQRERGARGREAEIYVANLDPIFLTLRSLGIEFNQSELQFALEILSEANDYFATYLTNIFEAEVVRTFSWNGLLSLYMTFIVEVLKSQDYAVFPMPASFSINKEKITSLLTKYPNVKQDLFYTSMQVSSPGLGLNPQFKAHLANLMKGLEEFEAFLLGLAEFMNELKKMGITNFSDLTNMFRERMDQLNQLKVLLERLKDLTLKIEKFRDPKEKLE